MEKTNEKKDFLQKTWVVCALALVCTFLWGSASPCIKLGYALFKIPSSETWTQVLFAGTRFVLAGVLTILIGSILNRKMLLPTKSSVPNIVKLAMFQTILQYIFFYIGLAHIFINCPLPLPIIRYSIPYRPSKGNDLCTTCGRAAHAVYTFIQPSHA